MSATTTEPEAPDTTRAGTGHLVELEGLRAAAAFAVLLTHAGFLSGAVGRDILPGFLARMDIGVPIFFVLSGFLLYRPHARAVLGNLPAPALRTYAVRRAARLVPAWLLVLLGTLALVPESRTASKGAWVANLLQVQSLRNEWDLPGLAQLWSLSTEAMFYVALPLLAWVIARRVKGRGARAHLLALAGVALAAWTFRVVVALDWLPSGISWLRTLPATGDWFVVGMVLAVVTTDQALHARAQRVVQAVPWHLYAAAAVVFWLLTTRAAGPYDLSAPTSAQHWVKHLGYTVVGALVVAPSVLGARTALSRVLRWGPVTYLGRISYGVFLWHMPLMFAIRRMLGLSIFTGGFWITVVLTTLAAVAVSALSWHLVEERVQRWSHRRTRSSAPQHGG
ncbi:MAG TPA: acyltransferase [Phycicoccus elongatus]|jgi:peptidoglycan/LPS O-acetylase OafA/YrhL|uniref:acyltransferase family protein n=1 Tax=Phycicoccus TaxID=367298 RepID=UPI0025894721|nr:MULTISPECIES: acyltransferase [Phycicoccus]MCO5302235.1 acyltransferase [Phycicoccus sp.]HPK11558.1 acyltransferase [Phycicoccus elongatus]HPK11566.1 acyltransferase [Phycicoccus elongatus]HPQ73924.1 acyltransferase [Phycicoccus elongatus]HPQ73932.1 acyltransferase [Phycicoccus elongatus]